MKRKNSGFVMTTILLDPEVRAEFEKCLPRDKSLADALREYMKEVVAEQKKVEGSGERLPILTSLGNRQTTISEYDIKLFEPSEHRLSKIKNMSLEQQTKLATDVILLQKQIRMVRK